MCEKCSDQGYYFTERGTLTICECKKEAQRQKKIEKIFGESAIPPNFSERTFEKYDPREGTKIAYDMALKLASSRQGGIILYGNTGVGKSYLAAAILNARLSEGRTGFYASLPTLLTKIKSTFKEGAPQTEEEILNHCLKADTLVLDDLGVEKVSPFSVEKLFQIIDYRIESGVTVITTNYSLDTISRKYGRRIGSRLSVFDWVLVEGQDRRQHG
jgi:DNA replication protein DnaC